MDIIDIIQDTPVPPYDTGDVHESITETETEQGQGMNLVIIEPEPELKQEFPLDLSANVNINGLDTELSEFHTISPKPVLESMDDNIHEGIDESKQFKCAQCTFKTTKGETLYKHIKSEHREPKLANKGFGKFRGKKLVNASEIKATMEPMSYAEAKSFLLKMVPKWKHSKKLMNEELKNAILELGWEFEGPNNHPVCNSSGRERLKEMFS